MSGYRELVHLGVEAVLATLPTAQVFYNEYKDEALILTQEGTVISVDMDGGISELRGGAWETGMEA